MRWWALSLLFLPLLASSQDQTVGLFLNTQEAENGYTLFTRLETVYLVDNCGYVVNTWEGDRQEGGVLYLLENGDLLRASRIPAAINGVPGGGRFVRYDWWGDVQWEFEYAFDTRQQHHDIEPMPNGNVLLLVWNYRSPEDAVEHGRDPDNMSPLGILYESVVEIRPIGTDSGEVVWEWHLWDHLVQDHDSTKLNFGDPADFPGKVNFNFNDYNGSYHHDWIHANAVAYDQTMDEVVISARNFSEVWVIDHTTTTEEAAGETGGRHGKGGDLVYRWGNPQAYGHGTISDRQLFGQHDVKFINWGGTDGDAIMAFNNGAGRDTAFSDVVVIDLPRDSNGLYVYKEGLPFAPELPTFSFSGTPERSLYSRWISSAGFLENGNLFVCEGNKGRFTEWTPNGELVWEYLSPLDTDGPVAQGEIVDWPDAFRASKFSTDHPALEDKLLVPVDPVELYPWPDSCEIYDGSGVVDIQETNVHLLNSLTSDYFIVHNPDARSLRVTFMSMDGQRVWSGLSSEDTVHVPAHELPTGMYIIQIRIGHSAYRSWKVIVAP